MAPNSTNQPKQSPFRLLALIFLLLGILELTIWVQGGGTATHHLIMGLGFLLIAPNAYLDPINGNTRVSTLFRARPRPQAAGIPQRLSLVGTLLLVASFAVQWM
ncbi:hypothetical protein GTP41_25765 [Pseudoduganella sp. DS3]|uniref:Uncharacterized protein n=1 Tax=Pseudoduganella guangdongensis TaxID=2692179 RepID=A0A6N9HRH4_9BURK|nr:hypothetical protein [Pseudoduganella guangdongensis]MYN05505.1 hypothetical protein [Pseudoduganella guangdongensis]